MRLYCDFYSLRDFSEVDSMIESSRGFTDRRLDVHPVIVSITVAVYLMDRGVVVQCLSQRAKAIKHDLIYASSPTRQA